ncbi:TolC family protein [Candidatus Desulforudis audaxviator]|uniref:Outer membrane protein-like protein n=1 Tax=Desulforudis audaxviator (strain MP104C) TaxID=477974 RepID=B1I6F9_DESAP|nr:TolC family protein [Candidatus Desulforudis audaxviator]ACA60607.1 outer membrane protein-like protein [Candidatus Desulforudis audaxviator MP104C]AZK60686.1 TolC family protein [Candidatus Desulforudis audaxviator]
MRRVLVLLFTVIAATWMFLVPAGWAKEPATPELTLNEAVTLAIRQSAALKKAGLDVDKAEELRRQAADQLTFTPVRGGSYDPRVEIAWYSLLSADLNWQMSKRTQNVEEDRLVLSTCRKYWDVLKAKEKVRAAEAGVRKAELALRKTRALARVGMSAPGMSPQVALAGAEAALAGARTGLAAARNELDAAYEGLNQLTGFWPQYRPVLVDSVEFRPVEVDNLDVHVQRVLESSPAVWLANEGVTLAKYAQELMWARGQYTPYKVRQIEVEQAELDAVSARDAVRLATRELYYSLRSLEAAHAAALEQVKAAQEALRVTLLAREVGMATAADVAEREAALAEAEQELFDLACQHAYLKLAFQKPWAVSAGGTGSR